MSLFTHAWTHIRRSPYQAFAAILTMTLMFIITGLFTVITIGSTVILNYFEKKPQIIVFFSDTKKEESIKALESKLKEMDKVASVKYVTKDEALAIYKEQFKKDPMLLEMVSADILPASIEVSATKIEYLKDLAETLKSEPDIIETVFPEDVVNLLTSWVGTIRKIGLVLVLVLGLVSLFTVFTVISMKIALKKEEIEIIQLVGGGKAYIRGPFIMEGIIYGLIGASVGWLINLTLLLSSTPFLSTIFAGIPLFPIPIIFYLFLFLGMIILGTALGMIASFLSINRYLK
jgi:cell division transport system permease protein